MKKVFQQNINPGDGDCMRCAVATLLGLSYEDVPHFLRFENPNSEMINFIMSKGFDFECCLYNYPGSDYSTIQDLSKFEGINGLFYASVFSPKYYKEENGIKGHQITHAVLINKNYEIVFDPNPNYQDLEKYPASEELGFNGINTVYLFEPRK